MNGVTRGGACRRHAVPGRRFWRSRCTLSRARISAVRRHCTRVLWRGPSGRSQRSTRGCRRRPCAPRRRQPLRHSGEFAVLHPAETDALAGAAENLRHTFGTLAVQVFPLSDVKAYMGHADIATTMVSVDHVPQPTRPSGSADSSPQPNPCPACGRFRDTFGTNRQSG